MGSPACVALVPCGHVCYCESCAGAAAEETCPICREEIRETLKLFYPGPVHVPEEHAPPLAPMEAPFAWWRLSNAGAAWGEVVLRPLLPS